ncbi:MAG: hypothetical protein JKY26_06360 [Pseudomonas sp.]|jgi:hypothetical protein|nr:hypothetical protein [Pseudomonas sp.]
MGLQTAGFSENPAALLAGALQRRYRITIISLSKCNRVGHIHLARNRLRCAAVVYPALYFDLLLHGCCRVLQIRFARGKQECCAQQNTLKTYEKSNVPTFHSELPPGNDQISQLIG